MPTMDNAATVTNSIRRWLPLFAVLVVLHGYAPTGLAKQAGKATFVKGVVTAHVEGESVRFLARGGKLFEGDIVTTARRSFAVLKLTDGTRMTLRPNTVFKLQEYSFEPEEEEGNALLRLFKGGLRAITGLISKKLPENYRLQTSIATIGIRGTEFEARLCADDCLEEASRIKQVAEQTLSPLAARVVFMRGRASAGRGAGESRKLSVGSSIFPGDIIETRTRSFVVMAFKDKSRVTLQPNTRFRIERHQFQPEEPETGSMFMRLIKGGLRAITGLIGKKNKGGFKIFTPAATIGIRGTGFDLICLGECTTEPQSRVPFESPWLQPLQWLVRQLVSPVLAQLDTGLIALSWSGEIVLQMAYGDIVITENQTVFIANNGAQPVPLPQIPVFIQDQQGPRPDKPESTAPGMEDPFAAVEQDDVEPGLYVTVYDGDVVMEDEDGNLVYLGEAASSFSDGDQAEAVRLTAAPRIVAVPSPTLFDDIRFRNIFELFDDGSEAPQNSMECVIS